MDDPFSVFKNSLWTLFLNSSQFSLNVNSSWLDASGLTCQARTSEASQAGCKHHRAHFVGPQVEVEQHILEYDGTALMEVWPEVRNVGESSFPVTRLDSFSIDLPPADYELLTFRSAWGQEFEPERAPLISRTIVETRHGRSSYGHHPWFALFNGQQSVFSGSLAWSGNWILRFEPLPGGGWRLSGGLNDWQFNTDLAPGSTLEAPHAILVLGPDLNAVSQQYTRVGRKYWYPHNALSRSLPVEWNHWWSYEDVTINAETFDRNIEAASGLGIEVCTLDAGWFGPAEPGQGWFDWRGDWDIVNSQRFPQGIRPLADHAHARGLKFGLWCEIEALGNKSHLAQRHPEFSARRAGQELGYLCFGSPAVQEWAYRTLSQLITQYQCDWIKLDFNVNPEAGCDRLDHGHGSGDGLYAHYLGYYHTLERLRQAFPEVVLENCSSGGMRIDLGISKVTHFTFLSDPDWPVHDLQIFWGATTMLAPDACLHWSFSEWRAENQTPHQTFNPRSPDLTLRQYDYYTRIAMLGACGFSQKLPDLPQQLAARLKFHIQTYQNYIRPFLSQGDLYRLTGQPQRDGSGDRWCAFQYRLPDASEHLLFVFRLPGSENERKIRLAGLQPDRIYSIAGFEGETRQQASGKNLMEEGLVFSNLLEEDSALLKIS
jgi:alpha-galactosidase